MLGPLPGSRPPTMEDVARASGLSRSTVSRVFTGDDRVSPDAQIKVREAARLLGYAPNMAASTLAGRRQGHLGLLIRDATNPAYGVLHSELNRAAAAASRALITVTARRHEYGHAETQGLQHLIGLGVAGLFVSTGVTPPEEIIAASSSRPMMIVGRPNDDPRINSVSYDERMHGRLMADHIAAHGHRAIAVLRGPELYSRVFLLRARSLVDRCAQLGIRTVEVDLLPVEHGVERALDAAAEQSLTCVVCPVDYVALDLLRAARRRGISVPEDVSVVGFDGAADGLDLIGLTTVSLPVREVARTAVAHMVRMVEADGSRPDTPIAPLPSTGATTPSEQGDETPFDTVEHVLIPGELVPGSTLAAL